jgi:hypothetical protein
MSWLLLIGVRGKVPAPAMLLVRSPFGLADLVRRLRCGVAFLQNGRPNPTDDDPAADEQP